MTIGPFNVAPDGTLSRRAPDLQPIVRYAWRGRPCAASVTDEALTLSGYAGRIPSTAERGADRAAALEALGDLRQELPDGTELHLLPDHRMVLRHAAPPVGGAISLVSEMVRFAMAMDPYLDRLAAAGAVPAVGASGRAKT